METNGDKTMHKTTKIAEGKNLFWSKFGEVLSGAGRTIYDAKIVVCCKGKEKSLCSTQWAGETLWSHIYNEQIKKEA